MVRFLFYNFLLSYVEIEIQSRQWDNFYVPWQFTGNIWIELWSFNLAKQVSSYSSLARFLGLDGTIVGRFSLNSVLQVVHIMLNLQKTKKKPEDISEGNWCNNKNNKLLERQTEQTHPISTSLWWQKQAAL